jgi:polar amino acid transport system substrate-binding protein
VRDEISDEIRKLRDSGELASLQEKWCGHKMEIPDSGYLPPGSK